MGVLPPPDQFKEAYTAIPEFMRLNLFRPVGIGMLIGGAVTGIVFALPLVLSAIRSMQDAARTKTGLSWYSTSSPPSVGLIRYCNRPPDVSNVRRITRAR